MPALAVERVRPGRGATQHKHMHVHSTCIRARTPTRALARAHTHTHKAPALMCTYTHTHMHVRVRRSAGGGGARRRRRPVCLGACLCLCGDGNKYLLVKKDAEARLGVQARMSVTENSSGGLRRRKCSRTVVPPGPRRSGPAAGAEQGKKSVPELERGATICRDGRHRNVWMRSS